MKDGTTQTGPGNQASSVDILSDTRGVDFAPYFKQLLPMIYKSWLPLIPEEARPPRYLKGETIIRFTINPDGKLAAMHLDASTRQVKLDRAAWGAITSIKQFPPLPAAFDGPNLELRIHFKVNTPQH